MKIVNIYEAKAQLSKLIESVRNGEEVTIAKAGKPQVKLSPVEQSPKKRVKLDALKGQAAMAENFDDLPPGFEHYR